MHLVIDVTNISMFHIPYVPLAVRINQQVVRLSSRLAELKHMGAGHLPHCTQFHKFK